MGWRVGGVVLKYSERNFLPSLFLTLVPKLLAVHSFSVLVFNSWFDVQALDR